MGKRGFVEAWGREVLEGEVRRSPTDNWQRLTYRAVRYLIFERLWLVRGLFVDGLSVEERLAALDAIWEQP